MILIFYRGLFWDTPLPGLTKPRQPELLQRLSVAGTDKDSLPDDNFFEQLMKMQVNRLNLKVYVQRFKI